MRPDQRGAVSIEFVLLFPLFLVIFYAIVSYGLSFAQLHLLNGMTAEATRSAVAVVTTEGEVESVLESRITSVIDGYGSLLTVTGCYDDGAHYRYAGETGELRVCLESALLLPSLELFGIRIPDIKSPLRSQASVRLGRMEPADG